MKSQNLFLEYVFPILALLIAGLLNELINIRIEGAFFSLYLSAIVLCAYYSGRNQALIITGVFILKIIFWDLSLEKIFLQVEEFYRLVFFLTSSSISIMVIQKLKQVAHENHQLRMAQQEFLSVVSHDLRNPLHCIQLNAELMNRMISKENLDEKIQRSNRAIMRNCASMNVLISDLLDLGGVDEKKKLNLIQVNSSELLNQVEELMLPLAQKKEISFKVLDHAEMDFTGDREKILRVFSNLIGNAIKFTPQGGRIDIEARSAQSGISFRVSDNGIGIPAEQLPKIFDRYWQAGHYKRNGIGLGLAIAKSIVEAHQGIISVESVLRSGTNFIFSIPVKPPAS